MSILPFTRQWRALLATSNSRDRDVLTSALEQCQFAVTVVADGDSALDVLEDAEFDLVLVERELPAQPGLRVVQSHRFMMALGDCLSYPAAILIAPELHPDVALLAQREATAAGFFAVLCRPLFVNEAAAVIRGALAANVHASATTSRAAVGAS